MSRQRKICLARPRSLNAVLSLPPQSISPAKDDRKEEATILQSLQLPLPTLLDPISPAMSPSHCPQRWRTHDAESCHLTSLMVAMLLRLSVGLVAFHLGPRVYLRPSSALSLPSAAVVLGTLSVLAAGTS